MVRLRMLRNPQMNVQLTLDGEPTVKAHNLSVYQVGDHDYYAANSAEEAEQLHLDVNELHSFDRETACLVSDAVLDTPWRDEDQPRAKAGTLRQWLSEAKEPCWLSGTE